MLLKEADNGVQDSRVRQLDPLATFNKFGGGLECHAVDVMMCDLDAVDPFLAIARIARFIVLATVNGNFEIVDVLFHFSQSQRGCIRPNKIIQARP